MILSFKKLIQLSTKDLFKIIIKPIFKQNQFLALLLILLRVITLGFFFNFKSKKKPIKFKYNNNNKFILDLRDSKMNLHLFAILCQFFLSIKKKYKVFEIWINDNTYSINSLRLYVEEFYQVLDLISDSISLKSIFKKSEKIDDNSDYIKISEKNSSTYNGKSWNDNQNLSEIFLNKFKLKSEPINYSLPNSEKFKKEPINSLVKIFKGNFNLFFYPTFDLNCKYESEERKYGVISKENFIKLKEIYLSIINEIDKNNYNKFKIFIINKKAIDWPVHECIYDLRNFENYNLTFSDILSLIDNYGNWSIGSEGTLMNYILLARNPKHIIITDNTHWKNISTSDGATVPFFYKEFNFINYPNKPIQYIPDKNDIIDKIMTSYKDFIKNN